MSSNTHLTQKADCLTFLLFRRVICEILTENLDMNASTFDFCPLQALLFGGILLKQKAESSQVPITTLDKLYNVCYQQLRVVYCTVVRCPFPCS